MQIRIYRKNEQGYYIYPLYNYPSIWLIGCLVVFVATKWLNQYLKIDFLNYLSFVSLIGLVSLAVYELMALIIGIRRNKGLWRYFTSLSITSAIRNSLLNTMTVNLYKDSPQVEVPAIKVTILDNKLKVYVSKLPGMYNLDKMEEDINAAIRTGKYKAFAITEAVQEEDGTGYNFCLTDVGTNKTFIPKSINDLIQKPYYLRLQNDLIINLSKSPHLAVWGQSGSGKTTVLMNIIAQCLSNDTELLFIDGKTEFSSFGAFYPSEKIATDNNDVLELLEYVSELIKKRQKIVADEVKKRSKLGLTGFDIGLKPVVVIGDEIGSIVASMDNKQKKLFVSYMTQLVQKGRSVSIFGIVASQSPAVDVLPQGIRSQFSTKILLGSASGDVQRMAFGDVQTSGNVEKFQGYYYSDGITIEPQKYFVPNLFTNNLENMETFKKLYEIGQKEKD